MSGGPAIGGEHLGEPRHRIEIVLGVLEQVGLEIVGRERLAVAQADRLVEEIEIDVMGGDDGADDRRQAHATVVETIEQGDDGVGIDETRTNGTGFLHAHERDHHTTPTRDHATRLDERIVDEHG